MSFATGLIINTIPCWLISAKNRSPSSENVMCLTTRRDLVLANHSLMDEIPADEKDLSAIGVESQAILPPADQALRVARHAGYRD
jgi:hypothetical protein